MRSYDAVRLFTTGAQNSTWKKPMKHSLVKVMRRTGWGYPLTGKGPKQIGDHFFSGPDFEGSDLHIFKIVHFH